MTRHLDARRRAMLLEMGIALPVLPARASPAAQPPAPPPPPEVPAAPLPSIQAAAAPAPVSAPPAAASPPAAAGPPATPAEARAGAWLAPALTLYAPGGMAAQAGGWLVVLECPQPAEPLAGDAGRLLDNMLRAMGLHGQPATRVAALVQPAQAAGGTAEPADSHPLPAMLAALRPRMVLLLGLGAARAVLGSREPLAQLRARVHRLADGTPAAVSHDPSYLLHAPEAKAAAWLDLCRALEFARAPSGDGSGRPPA